MALLETLEILHSLAPRPPCAWPRVCCRRERRPERWLPLCHCDPNYYAATVFLDCSFFIWPKNGWVNKRYVLLGNSMAVGVFECIVTYYMLFYKSTGTYKPGWLDWLG